MAVLYGAWPPRSPNLTLILIMPVIPICFPVSYTICRKPSQPRDPLSVETGYIDVDYSNVAGFCERRNGNLSSKTCYEILDQPLQMIMLHGVS